MSRLIFLIFFTTVISINNQCEEKLFILITKQKIFLLNFNFNQNDYLSNIIYETKYNSTIEYGLFNKRTNTIILLINQFNQTYSISSLNVQDNIYNNWIEKSNKIISSSYMYLSMSQRYIYLLNNQTMFIQIFSLPLTSTPFKQNYLLNLPKNQTIINYIIDEKLQLLWILFENVTFYQIYTCQLKYFLCYLYMNIFNLNKPIQLIINSKSQQFYLKTKKNLIIFDYNQNQVNYSIDYLNSTEQIYLTICEKTNSLEYITINQEQICYQTCQDLPFILNNENSIHTIERLSSVSDILYCSKQRRISKIVLLILILIDLLVLLSAVIWLGYKYFFQTTLDKNTQQSNSGTIWTTEKEFITHF